MQLYELNISWLPWSVALLIGLLLLINVIQPHAVTHSLRALSSPIQRRYISGENNPLLWLFRSLFQLGVISLSLLVAINAGSGHNELSLVPLGKMMVVILVVVAIKAILDRWIQLTFKYALNAKTYYKYRSELWMIMSVLLLVALLLTPWLGEGCKWIIPLVFGLYYMVLWWKLMQVFGWNIEHIGYTLLYMAHVEVLPMVAVWVIGYRI